MSSTVNHAGSTAIPRPIKIILAVLVFTAFVMMLNETTLAVAMPSIMSDYSISATTAQWLLTGFMLTMAVVLPTTGWILERFTTRAVFIFAIAAFLIGTVMAAVAPTFELLLAARVAQAIGTAVVMPLLMTVAMTVVPAQRRGSIMGLVAVVMAVGPGLGPTVAGLILSISTWHAIFWFMVPLVSIAALVGTVMLKNINEPRATPFDLLSVLLSIFAFGGLVYALSSGGAIIDGGTGARIPLIAVIVGVVGLVLFVWRQRALGRKGRALLDLRPLKIRSFTIPLIVFLGLLGALIGVLNTLPLYLQGSLLVSALVAGLVMLPGGLLEGLLSPFVGRLYDRYGPRPLIIPGMFIAVASLFWLATVDQDTNVWLLVIIYLIFSIGVAVLFTPLMTAALGAAPTHLYGHASAILNTSQQLAGAAGTAIMIAVYSGVGAAAQANEAPETVALADGANSAFLASAIVAAVALIFSLFIPRSSIASGHAQTKVREGTTPSSHSDS
ncbi:MDR family MFS transporter [Corynebacterium sp. A21]|uniref:MDR family MFS transporter n=1 Tax=Corynebacterium sp. A21 TaxID=3457318 RepID=UPI003FD12AD1